MLFAEMTEVLDPEPHAAALNMAIDEALLTSAPTPLLRIYRWALPAISFGYFEKFADLGTAASGREAVRRWTGGGVVLHGEDVTYTLIVPASHPFACLPPRETYRQIHECLVLVLRQDGFEPRLAPAGVVKVSHGCFENAVEADVLMGTRKIAGAAQRRTRHGLLHQGSIQGGGKFLEASLAGAFARNTIHRVLDKNDVTTATRVAELKYGTDAWLRRF